MAEGKVLPYLDIPFQHASPRILKLMKRPGARRERARAHPRAGARSARTHAAQHLHRRLPRRDRGRLRGAARLARRGAPRPRRLLQVLAGRGRGGERAARSRARGGEGRALEPLHGTGGRDQRGEARGQGRPRACACWSTRSTGDGAIARSSADAPEIDGVVRIARPASCGRRLGRRRDHGRRRLRSCRAKSSDRRNSEHAMYRIRILRCALLCRACGCWSVARPPSVRPGPVVDPTAEAIRERVDLLRYEREDGVTTCAARASCSAATWRSISKASSFAATGDPARLDD